MLRRIGGDYRSACNDTALSYPERALALRDPAQPASTELPTVPSCPLDGAGQPLVGLYAGALDSVRWGYPRGWAVGQVERALTRKRWFRVTVSDGDLLVVMRLTDLGYSGHGWITAVDLATGKTLFDRGGIGMPLSTLVVGPMAGAGADAFLKLGLRGLRLRRSKTDGIFRLKARWPKLKVDLRLDADGAAPSVAAIGETGPKRAAYAQRTSLLPVAGAVQVGKRRLRVGANARGCIEYVNGFFPRAGSWRTALICGESVDDRLVGAYLTDTTFFGTQAQDVAWEPTRAIPLAGHATINVKAPDDPWEIRDGAGSALFFAPRAGREHAIRTGVVRVRTYHQFGRFIGTLKLPDGSSVPVDGVPGLCSSTDVAW